MPTKIEWTQETWNPITGCTKTSEGCQNCYAERMAKRLAGRYGYPELPDQFTPTFHANRMLQPAGWKKPSLIFVCSMGDLFHDGVKPLWLADVFKTMHNHSRHIFLLLTKRPEGVPQHKSWWRKNIWLGVTAENQQRADERIPVLLEIPAAVRFVSVEPMLDLVDLDRHLGRMRLWQQNQIAYVELAHQFPNCEIPKLDWVICGCESGPRRRPTDIDWIRSLRDQCVSAGVPFFLKQMDLSGKVVSMPELDGRAWNQMPGDRAKHIGGGA